MGRTNIEKEFKDKLNQREIQPSQNSWDRLDAMLTVGEEKKPKTKFNWLLIAASFIGLLLIATLFFNNAENADQIPVIVEQNNDTPAEVNNKETLPLEMQQIEAIAATESAVKSSQTVKNNSTPVRQIAHVQPEVNQPQQNRSSIINQNQNQPNPSIQADELLAMVQSNPTNEPSPKSAVKVSAKSLLSQVDNDTDPTFRQKVLRQFGKNYQNVKVALSNRNIEEENH